MVVDDGHLWLVFTLPDLSLWLVNGQFFGQENWARPEYGPKLF
jgi:hypothetical protein